MASKHEIVLHKLYSAPVNTFPYLVKNDSCCDEDKDSLSQI